MHALTTLVSSPGVASLSQALLHFLWQGLALALLAGVGLLALRRASASARYAFLLGVLALMLFAPVVTFAVLHRAPAAGAPVSVPAVAPAMAPPLSAHLAPIAQHEPPTLSPLTRLRVWLLLHLQWLAALWAAGVCALSLRLLMGWLGLGAVRRRAVPLEAWRARLEHLAARLGVTKRVLLLQSARVPAPALLGWLRPAILLPAAAVIGLTPQQLELILAHELAHLRRHDYVVNVLQSLAETLLFYHPAVWWLSRRTRLEREYCCDDLVAEALADRAEYARALAALGQVCSGATGLAPAGSGGNLSQRVRRLLRAPAAPSERSPLIAGVVALGFVAVLIMGVHAARPAAAKPKAAARTEKGKLDLREVRREEARLREALAKVDRERDDVLRRLQGNLRREEQLRRQTAATVQSKDGKRALVVNLGPKGAALEQEAQALVAQQAALQLARYQLVERVKELASIRSRPTTQAEVDRRLQAVRAKEQADLAVRKAQLEARLAAIRARQEATQAEQASIEQRLKEIEAEQQAGAETAPPAPAETVANRMYKLEFLEPQYVLYLFGLSDDPGPSPYQSGEGSAEGTPPVPGAKPAPSMDLHGAGKGMLHTFLPEGVGQVVVFPLLHSLLINGTPEAVDKLTAFLKLIDRQPQQVWVETTTYRGRPENGRPTEVAGAAGALGVYVLPAGEKEFRFADARSADRGTMATFSLVPAETNVSGGGYGYVLQITPRMNGDHTITMAIKLEVSWATGSPLVTHTRAMAVTVNVREGEPVAIAYEQGGKEYSLVVRATVGGR